MYAAGSKTSASVGAMFMSPQTTALLGRTATTRSSAPSQASL